MHDENTQMWEKPEVTAIPIEIGGWYPIAIGIPCVLSHYSQSASAYPIKNNLSVPITFQLLCSESEDEKLNNFVTPTVAYIVSNDLYHM